MLIVMTRNSGDNGEELHPVNPGRYSIGVRLLCSYLTLSSQAERSEVFVERFVMRVNLLARIESEIRISSASVTDDELRELYAMKDEGIVDVDLFNEKPDGELISFHPYWYKAGETRFMNGKYPDA